MTAIGNNIKSNRQKLGITQEQLAEKINVTRQAVSNWENGKTEPDLETISVIAEVFGIDSYDLINNKTAKTLYNFKKNRFFKTAVIFGILAIMGLIITIILEEPSIRLRKEYYKAELYMVLAYIIEHLIGLFFGISIAFFSKIVTNFSVKNKILRICVLILGIVSAILTTLFAFYFISVVTLNLPFRLSFSANFLFYQQKIVIGNPMVHTLAPILIFYGINFEKEGEKL